MTPERLKELLSQFPSRRIAVFGDYFLDRYLDFDSELAEVSLETGKTANQVVDVRHSPGAAGTVVCNLHALGCQNITTAGFSGDDGEGYELRQDLTSMSCIMDHLLQVPERRTPVYCKPRDIRVPGLTGESERYDTKNRQTLPRWVEEKLITSLDAVLSQTDALIILDQVEENNCGAVTDRIRARLTELASNHPNLIFWVDSRNRISEYSGVIIKPNQHEAIAAAFPDRPDEVTDDLVIQAGRILSERSGRPVFVTRAEHGMLVFNGDGCESIQAVQVDGQIDPTGAGDSATASAVLTLASGGTLAEAALMANLVASITIQQLGTTGTATPEQIINRLDTWRAQHLDC